MAQLGDLTAQGIPRGFVGFTYIDNFGMLTLAEPGDLSVAQQRSAHTTDSLRAAGLDARKVDRYRGWLARRAWCPHREAPHTRRASSSTRPYSCGGRRTTC